MATASVDDLDRELVHRLRADGRESNRSLAAALGVNEGTIAARLRRLESLGIMRVVAITDMRAFGLHCLTFVFCDVAGAAPGDAVAAMAEVPEAIAVSTCTGPQTAAVTILTRDAADAAQVIGERISACPGVVATRCEVAVDIARFESSRAGIQLDHGDLPSPPVSFGRDDADRAIIAALQRDARSSNRSIAAEIGVSEATVRARLRQMTEAGSVRIQAVCDVEAFGLGAHGYVALRAAPGRLEEVRELLLAEAELGLIARTLGTRDYVAVAAAESRGRLVEIVLGRIAGHPAVASADLYETCATIKHVYTWGRLA